VILFSHKIGQLGNQLFAYAHLIANAAAANITVVNLSFEDYANSFQGCQGTICRYPPAKSKGMSASTRVRSILFLLNRATLKLLRTAKILKSPLHEVIVADLPDYTFGQNKFYELGADSFQLVARRKPFVFLFGRFFRDYENFEKYKHLIRRYFTPTLKIQNIVDKSIVAARQNSDIVVGVHIRRGDYAQFKEGKYFFSQEQYAEKMAQLKTVIPEKRITFVLCSNESIDSTVFHNTTCVVGPGGPIEDMYLLAQCDYVMGPPSTFSAWASFYGNKPLYHIQDIHQSVAIENFVHLPPIILYNF
jgi:hypothetical protein